MSSLTQSVPRRPPARLLGAAVAAVLAAAGRGRHDLDGNRMFGTQVNVVLRESDDDGANGRVLVEREQMLDLLISTFEEVLRSRQREYEAKLSEETAREIDLEVRRIIDACLQEVKGILARTRNALEAVAAVVAVAADDPPERRLVRAEIGAPAVVLEARE